MLKKFYAVTKTSVYLVKSRRNKKIPVPVAKKIAVRGKSEIGVGEELKNGSMLAITRELQMFVPEGGGLGRFERNIEMVNTRYWGGHSTEIVALFITKRAADSCFEKESKIPADPRWLRATKGVLNRIGDDHPTISVCKYGDLNLLA